MKIFYILITSISFSVLAQPEETPLFFDNEVMNNIELIVKDKKESLLSNFDDVDVLYNNQMIYMASETSLSVILLSLGNQLEKSPLHSRKRLGNIFILSAFALATEAWTRFYLRINGKDAGVSPFYTLGKKSFSVISNLHDNLIAENFTKDIEVQLGSVLLTGGSLTFLFNSPVEFNELDDFVKAKNIKRNKLFGGFAAVYGAYLLIDGIIKYNEDEFEDVEGDNIDRGKLYALRINDQGEVTEEEIKIKEN